MPRGVAELSRVALAPTPLQPGDSNRDLSFDQLDIVQVLRSGRYLTGDQATWGEGDWNGAPGGSVNDPPIGDGIFNQRDLIAALQTRLYQSGPYASTTMAAVVVPEPSTIGLLLTATWLIAIRALTKVNNGQDEEEAFE